MNDFTKDELKFINMILAWHGDVPPKIDITEQLDTMMIKIQYMINNHCDHDWDDAKNQRKYFRCSKCRKAKV